VGFIFKILDICFDLGFWIGESGIWFFSLMWRHEKDKAPLEFLDDRGIVK
jgi:hypothetical protein